MAWLDARRVKGHEVFQASRERPRKNRTSPNFVPDGSGFTVNGWLSDEFSEPWVPEMGPFSHSLKCPTQKYINNKEFNNNSAVKKN
jgi:hypothetical protein